MEKMQRIKDMKHGLIDKAYAEIESGITKPEEIVLLGEIVDMIKDLADAEKNCMEACYYDTVVDAMHEAEDEPMGYSGSSFNRTMRPSYGYNNRRYANGRYAPKGRGRRMGYMPETQTMVDEDGYMVDAMHDTRHGRAYNEYQDAKRHYHETNSKEWHDKMKDKSEEHMRDTMDSLREMWHESDEDTKHKLKDNIQKLMQEME